MKTTARVFIWIGMIFNFYLIFPIIVGINALNKLDTAKTKKELTTSAWLTFWFCNIIGGICMLQIKEQDLTHTNTSASPTNNIPANRITNIKTSEVKIKKNQLYDNKDFKMMSYWALSALVLSVGLILLSIFHYACNISPFLSENEALVIVICSIIGGLFAALFILTLSNKFNLLKLIKTLLCCVSVVLIFTLVLSFVDSLYYDVFRIRYSCGGDIYLKWSWEKDVFTHPSSNCIITNVYDYRNVLILPILMTIISAILIVITIIFFRKCYKIKEPSIIEKNEIIKEKIIISPIEQEINNIKSLMDKGVIDEEEYKTLRKGIIEKYSKN